MADRYRYHRARMEETLFALVAIGSVVAAIVWGRSTRFRHRAWERIRRNGGHIDARRLARAHYRKDLHTTLLYVAVAVGAAVTALASLAWGAIAFLTVLGPVAFTLGF